LGNGMKIRANGKPNPKIGSSSSGIHIEERCWLLFIPKEATISASSAHGQRAGASARIMKKAAKAKTEMLAEYDFSRGVRGKYARRYAQGTNVVVLEPDVAKAFPDAKSVNRSLRALAGIIREGKKAVAG
jgi:hypothetical protein